MFIFALCSDDIDNHKEMVIESRIFYSLLRISLIQNFI